MEVRKGLHRNDAQVRRIPGSHLPARRPVARRRQRDAMPCCSMKLSAERPVATLTTLSALLYKL